MLPCMLSERASLPLQTVPVEPLLQCCVLAAERQAREYCCQHWKPQLHFCNAGHATSLKALPVHLGRPLAPMLVSSQTALPVKDAAHTPEPMELATPTAAKSQPWSSIVLLQANNVECMAVTRPLEAKLVALQSTYRL
jgi:hypothetical protein